MKNILCANCAQPMSLTRVSSDTRTPGQQVFSCGSCRLIEIRPPHTPVHVGSCVTPSPRA